MLANTGVHQPVSAAPPALIRLARSGPLRELVCVRTPTFVRGATAVSRPARAGGGPAGVRGPVRPAGTAPGGGGVRGRHPARGRPSEPADAGSDRGRTDRVRRRARAAGLGRPRPVFTPRYLEDLLDRLPHADVQWYPRASHLVTEDEPDAVGDDLALGAARTARPGSSSRSRGGLWDGLTARPRTRRRRSRSCTTAEHASVSFAELDQRVRDLAAGLRRSTASRPGQRVAVLVPPGIELMVAVYACWRAGASIVVADAGLGLRRMAAALRSAGPDHVIGIPKALLAAKALRVPGRRIADSRRTGGSGAGTSRCPSCPTPTARRPCCSPRGRPARRRAWSTDTASCGPSSKRSARRWASAPDDRLVAAFAPFALYGPALGVAAAVPDMDVTGTGHPDRRRARRRGRGRRGHGGLRLARRAAQRGRDQCRAHAAPAHGARPGPAADVGRRAGPRRACSARSRCCCRMPNCTPRTG